MPKRKAQTAVPAVPKASLGARIKKDIIKNYQLYLLMIPGFLLLILFKIGPVGAMVIAFEDFSAAKGVFGSTWVGLENFKRILQDPYIWKITKNTIVLAFLSVVVVFPIPIVFSLFLNEVRTKWVRNTVQSLSFLPYFISAAVMVSIMYTLLSPTSGLINILITKLGGTSTNFMAKPEWFRPLYVILEIWQTFGYSAIIYIAAMMNIDPTLYEAAEIDGASRWTKMWRITLPCISTSVITMLCVLCGYHGWHLSGARRNDFLTDGLQLESFRLYSDKPALQCVRRYAKLFFIYCAGDTAGGSLHLRYGVRAQPATF